MAKKKRDEDEDGPESLGSDLEQMVAMLEKAEIDYDQDTEDEEETKLIIQDEQIFRFDEDGNLVSTDVIY
jgi:hypothetical protein